MTNKEVREMLEKQLQLLSEHSKETAQESDLALITHAMCEITRILFEP